MPFFGHKSRREREWEEVRAHAEEDLVALGDDIRSLDVDIQMPGVADEAKQRYEQALEPWIAGQMDHVISIEPRFISGIRLVGWCS